MQDDRYFTGGHQGRGGPLLDVEPPPKDVVPFTSPCKLEQLGCTEETGKRILARLDDIDRMLSLLLTSGVQLDCELLRMGNANEATARALMVEFDRRIGKWQ